VRLLVCLVSLLKTVHNLKDNPVDTSWGYFNLVDGLDLALGGARTFEQMRYQLNRITSYYARHLAHHCFPADSPVQNCFITTDTGIFISYSIFSALDDEIARILRTENTTEAREISSTAKETIVPSNYSVPLNVVFTKPTTGDSKRKYLRMGSPQAQQREDSAMTYCCQVEKLSLALAGCSLVTKGTTMPDAAFQMSSNAIYTPAEAIISKFDSLETEDENEQRAQDDICGHVFLIGETMLRCETCGHVNSVLCARCASDCGHQRYTNHVLVPERSQIRGAYCDCGDSSAWTCTVKCMNPDGKSLEPDKEKFCTFNFNRLIAAFQVASPPQRANSTAPTDERQEKRQTT